MATQNGTAGNDTLTGGATNDVMNGFGGNDVLTGFADVDILDGGAGNDTLNGGLHNDKLTGGAGNDRVDGGLGEDTMIGGAGNDSYFVSEVADQVVELAGGGTDTITADVSNLSLADYDNVEILNLSFLAGAATASGSDRGDALNGNIFANVLSGDKGNDTLDGGDGDDTLKGGLGNDTYYVSNAGDQVIEVAGQGKDTVFANVSYTLTAGQEIEVLTLAGIGMTDGKGNELANIVNGNSARNFLYGMGGNDTLNGGAGNDVIDGGTLADVMNGGKGDDDYIVDNVGDKVTEAAGQGYDGVTSFVNSYTLGANVEELTLSGFAINGTGNALANLMIGTVLGNKLDGAGGNDIIYGDAGLDTLLGGAGDDFLDGESGADTMIGGGGNDFCVMDSKFDVVTELAGGGIDLVQASVDGFALADNVENLTLVGGSDLQALGNALNNVITGNSGQNSLIGGKGNDTLDGAFGIDEMLGGTGNDTYFVDNAGDNPVEDAGEGKDTVFVSVSYSLFADQEIEVLTLTGTGDLTALGNNFANTINGNAGNNTLNGFQADDTLNGGDGNDSLFGGAGNDVMVGGKGNDRYFLEDVGDKITEAAGQGRDIVMVNTLNYTLGANLEVIEMEGGAGNAVGNALDNRIEGNNSNNKLDGGGGNDEIDGYGGADTLIGGAGNDSLIGGAGDDKLTGGAGNDTYSVDSIGDVVTELAGGGTDNVRATIGGLVLGAFVENLGLFGSADISGSGNELSNKITGNLGKNLLIGNGGNDTLDGDSGMDTMKGGLGNDVYFVSEAGDIVQETAGQGKDTVNSSITFNFTDSLEIETVILSSAAAIGSVGNNFDNTLIMTGTGQATLNGNDGNDTVTGGSGNDILIGGGGKDVMDGGAGNDLILGDDDNDKLNGGEGDDILQGGAGKDAMTGGKGEDTYFVAEIGDTVTELAGQGHDSVESQLVSYTLTANVEDLTLSSGAVNGTGNTLNNVMTGNSANNKLDGGSGADVIFGGSGNDTVLGGIGFDYLSGGTGNDTLKGGADVDYLDGGVGADVMYGEAGKDGFLYRTVLDSELATLGGDTIHGFQTGVDRIELTDLLDDFGIDPGDAIADGFVLLTKMGADTLVQFDKDGFGGTGPLTLATVVNATVAAGDLMLDSQFIL